MLLFCTHIEEKTKERHVSIMTFPKRLPSLFWGLTIWSCDVTWRQSVFVAHILWRHLVMVIHVVNPIYHCVSEEYLRGIGLSCY